MHVCAYPSPSALHSVVASLTIGLRDMSVLVLIVTPCAVLWALPEQSSLCMCARM